MNFGLCCICFLLRARAELCAEELACSLTLAGERGWEANGFLLGKLWVELLAWALSIP